ncbi:hypothetical protein BGZ63DRAFT_265118 [Mariannaea sp. PMI_226]|nr:hypothetical protein BGZ63DRAFT_265118 [Mariannaea sp. PMI_226]
MRSKQHAGYQIGSRQSIQRDRSSYLATEYPSSCGLYHGVLLPAMRTSISRIRQMATFAAEYDQVPEQIRCSLELVRTCDHDLQQLIQLRNDHTALLRRESGAIDSIDKTIEAARRSLERIFRLVESCRPEAHDGKTPFRNKLKWALVDSLDFQVEEPVLRRRHATVLAEASYVQQVIQAAIIERAAMRAREERQKHPVTDVTTPTVFENLNLLGDIMGDRPVNNKITSNRPVSVAPDRTSSPLVDVNYGQLNTEHISESPLPLPLHDNIDSAIDIHEMDSNPYRTTPSSYCDEKEVVSETHRQKSDNERVVLSSTDSTGLSILLDHDNTRTSYLAPPPQTASSLTSVSVTSLASTVPYRYIVSPVQSIQSDSILHPTQSDLDSEITGDDRVHSWTMADAFRPVSMEPQHRSSLPPWPAILQDGSSGMDAFYSKRYSAPLTSSNPSTKRGIRRRLPHLDLSDIRDFADNSDASPVELTIETARVEPLSTIPPELIYIHKRASSMDSKHVSLQQTLASRRQSANEFMPTSKIGDYTTSVRQ